MSVRAPRISSCRSTISAGPGQPLLYFQGQDRRGGPCPAKSFIVSKSPVDQGESELTFPFFTEYDARPSERSLPRTAMYSEAILDHFQNPRNAGTMEGARLRSPWKIRFAVTFSSFPPAWRQGDCRSAISHARMRDGDGVLLAVDGITARQDSGRGPLHYSRTIVRAFGRIAPRHLSRSATRARRSRSPCSPN